jgi:predicted dienelactone hydrolase
MMMKITLLYIFLIINILFFSSAESKTVYGIFHDANRNRDVPYKVYYPDELSETYPVIIFSHGLGGSVEAAEYLGENLSQNGYVCFHIQHEGSDESIWKGAKSLKEAMTMLKKSIKDVKNAENRFRDIPFVVDEIFKLNRNSEIFKGHLDTINIGIIGHSYGARSVLIASGEKVGKGKYSFKEPRIKVGVALSPNLPENPPKDLNTIYEDINIPLFHITGTEDGDPLQRNSDFDPKERTIPYQNIKNSPQYLLILYKAVHSTFNGNKKDDPLFNNHIEVLKKGITAFLNFYLKNKESDGVWLKNDFRNTIDSKDTFEWKK